MQLKDLGDKLEGTYIKNGFNFHTLNNFSFLTKQKKKIKDN
jgi:hypothetical protein